MRGSFGRSLPGIEHRIIDPETGAILGDGEPGEICVRGYNMMAGIYKQEQADTFDEEGWYRTGDLGTFREGYLYYFGRRTEMIKSAGANVSPREVEAALEALPGVQAAAVVGLPDSQRGQIVAAAIVPSPGSAVSVADVTRRIADQVSSYKVPRFIVVLDADELPMLPTGKPNKQALALLLQQRQIDGLRQARPRS
jgi:acyl-CoA synthetase (AMP-forming)/AMP-acid ligase II